VAETESIDEDPGLIEAGFAVSVTTGCLVVPLKLVEEQAVRSIANAAGRIRSRICRKDGGIDAGAKGLSP
jgi:hypothetical protein